MNRLKSLPANRYIDIALFLFLGLFPLLFTPFRTELMGKTIVFILFALSLDLVWGYTGLMSFGHAVLFGLGGYILALSFTFSKGVPDFMQRFGITEIPVFFRPLLDSNVAFLLGLVIPGLFAAFLGYFIFSSKVSGIFFSLITLALSQICSTFLSNQQKYTNGSNGLGGLPRMLLFNVRLNLQQVYYIALAICIVVYLLCLFLGRSRFGKILQSIRENEPRLAFLGYKPARYKIAVYTISGMLAGLAGMLYIPMNSFISPNDVGIALSTSVLIWVAVGGRGNLTGAIAGTILVNWLQILLSEKFSDVWTLVLGILILLIVFVIPQGLVGKLIDMQYKYSARNIIELADAETEGDK